VQCAGSCLLARPSSLIDGSSPRVGWAAASRPIGTNKSLEGHTLDQAGAEKAQALADGDNLIAWGSSVITHNGQFISGKATGSTDWMHQKGSRSAQVQAELALTGRGSLATP
jgi:hypothetical protein